MEGRGRGIESGGEGRGIESGGEGDREWRGEGEG